MSMTIDVSNISLSEFASLHVMITFVIAGFSQLAWIACQKGQEKRQREAKG
jgi:hypothetical protein